MVASLLLLAREMEVEALGVPKAPTGDSPRRVLVADTTPAGRAVLEPLIRDEGYEILSAESSFQVLRTVRDARVDLVLINPDLSGSGMTGADVVKVLKSATQFRRLPVLFLLHGERQAPTGIRADGSIQLDRWERARVLYAIRQALGLGESGVVGAEEPSPPEGPTDSPLPAAEPLLGALTGLMERLTAQLESNLAQAAQRIATVVQEFLAKEGSSFIRQELRGQLREVVQPLLRELARETMPDVAKRRWEIAGVKDERRSPRVEVDWDITVDSDGGSEWKGKMMALGAFGVKVRLEATEASPPEGAIVRLRFVPPDRESPMSVKGLVWRSDPDGLVIVFLHLSAQEFLFLDGLATSLQKRSL